MELNWKTYQSSGKLESDLAEQFVANLQRKKTFDFYGNQTAIYFFSSNAGCFSSISFWKNALEHSPRFANPGIFPWTLANATSGFIARKFDITGPNYTLVASKIDIKQLNATFKMDCLKFHLKNALCIQWELKEVNKLLFVTINCCVLTAY